MASIRETAYRTIKSNISEKEISKHFTLNQEELEFVKLQAKSPIPRLGLALLLKSIQYLGYFIKIVDLPERVIGYVSLQLGYRHELDLRKYDNAGGTRSRHQKYLREYLNLKPVGDSTHECIKQTAYEMAKTRNSDIDIINAVLEILVKENFEFPRFSTIDRTVRAIRTEVNQSYFREITDHLPNSYKVLLDDLLISQNSGQPSLWDNVKQEPSKPTSTRIRDFVEHFSWLNSLHQIISIEIPKSKQKLMVDEARSLDAAALKALEPNRRYALMSIFIDNQSGKLLDDMAKMFVKLMEKLRSKAKVKLEEHQLKHQERADQLIEKLNDLIGAYQTEGSIKDKFMAIQDTLEPNVPIIKNQCEQHLAYAYNNYYLYLYSLYVKKRGLIFKCVDALPLRPATQDTTLVDCLDFIKNNRRGIKEWIPKPDLDLSWLPEKARKLVTGKASKKALVSQIHRKYFELCVFLELVGALKSLDVYVKGSKDLGDYRTQLISEELFDRQKKEYSTMMAFPTEAISFVHHVQKWMAAKESVTDHSFPSNEYVTVENGNITIKKGSKNVIPQNYTMIDEQLKNRMESVGIMDLITHTEKWLNLSPKFKPISGVNTRIANHQQRFIASLFCYGCNLGPVQTARSVTGINRKQIAWVNTHFVTEDRLDSAIEQVINYYNKYKLPKYWGSGKSASADGTKWDVYEQNLLSEYHIRYGGYGGIGYYHVSDTYIALFSHFIPCGVYEAVYILDGLLKNTSDIQPDTLHGDTQAQNESVFGLAYLLGIKLMPRIRNLKKLTLYKPFPDMNLQHIDGLFTDVINWDIIQTHLPDMLRVVLSIKAGKIMASTILRRLGTHNRKNKLYFAFRELGRAIRTGFLMDYFRDEDLRKMIQAATNKSEEYNGFTKWIAFGNNGKITSNLRQEQTKMIKYNHLVANLLVLYNVNEMTRVINDLIEEGFPIDADLLRSLSPYRTEHINRFGKYRVDLEKDPIPVFNEIDFNI